MAESKLIITTNAKQVADELKLVSDGLKDIDKNQKYIFDNAQLIEKQYGKNTEAIKDAQKAQQQLATTSGTELKREKGLIEDIESELARLREAKKQAWDEKDIAKYNNQIAEAQKNLEEYNKLGLKSEKTTTSLTQSIGKWVLGLASAAAILKKLKEAWSETVQGMNFFNQVGAVTRQVLNDIVNGTILNITHIREAIAAQRVLNELRVEESFDMVKVAKLNNEYQQAYAQSINQMASKADQLASADLALKKHNEAIDIQVEHTKKALEAQRKLVENNPTNEKIIIEFNKLRAELENLEAERVATTKRLLSRRSGIVNEFFTDVRKALADNQAAITQWEDDYAAERLKKQEEYQQLALQLLDNYDKSVIDSLEGKEKLDAQRKYDIAQLKEFEKQLAKLGPVTEDQRMKLQEMVNNIWTAYYKELSEGAKDTKPTAIQQEAITNALLGNIPELEGLIKKNIEDAQNEINDIVTANKAMEPFSIWKLLGLDPEDTDDQEMISSIMQSAEAVNEILTESLDNRVQIAQRERELLDTKIAETQRSIELEQQLYEEGYANNLTAQKEYLRQLQAEREKALVEEEKAIKRQQLYDKITQTGSLLSSVAQILASATKKGLAGLALAPFAIATLWAIWGKAKSSTSKLAEGGSGTETGIITGKRHSQGGERFLDHVEVEHGEQWGVLSRPASAKYGEMFHDMVSSFNKDQMPSFMPISNQVRIENSGPNARLDKVNGSIKKLNDTIVRQVQISNIGGKKIIRNGNKIRIVG